MKNYFDHDVKVKIQESLLSKSSDWQWLINHIQDNFDLDDICDMDSYEKRYSSLRDTYNYFIRITDYTDITFAISNNLLFDIYIIAQFFNSKKNIEEVKDNLKSIFGRILFIFAYITKIENKDNNTSYIMDKRIYRTKNFWELINFNNISLYSDDIKQLISEVTIQGFDSIRKCITDNLNKTYYPKNAEFIKKYRNAFLDVNAFRFQDINNDGLLTWQEEYLLDMVKIEFRGKGIIPLSEIGGYKNPDYTLWTEDIISKLKSYFQDEFCALFIIETIDYVMHNNSPSENVILKHFELLNRHIEENEFEIDMYCSSFHVISMLFNNKYLDNLKNTKEYKKFIRLLHRQENPIVINKLKNKFLPISKEQKQIFRIFCETEYKKIDDITEENDFIDYIKNENNIKFLNLEYFDKVLQKFDLFIKKKNDVITAILFYDFMCFLQELKSKNLEINKLIIETQMISLQKLWQEEYFAKVRGSLHSYSAKAEFSNDDIENYNIAILSNPNYFAKQCMSVKKEDICASLESTAKYPLRQFCTNVIIEETFPKLRKVDLHKEHHKIDLMLKDLIKEIKEEKGYRLLNNLDDECFLVDLHDQWQNQINFFTRMIVKVEELYWQIIKISPVELLPFGELTIGHVAQLFPVLEIKIRKLGTLGGIFPFKENDFMKYKDPSSILTTILSGVYNEIKDFGPVNDIFFVYNVLFNSNSLNLRNEFIHGRRYIEKYNLNFAFKLVLISIYLIQKRIDIIIQNETIR